MKSIVSNSFKTKESPEKLKFMNLQYPMEFCLCRASLEFYIHPLYEYVMDQHTFVAQIENFMISMMKLACKI